MNIEELNIGNWIAWNNEPCKVVGINPPYLDVVDCKNKPAYGVHIEEVAPIEITTWKLKRNGFTKRNNSQIYYRIIDSLGLSLYIYKCSSHCSVELFVRETLKHASITINYIHQLQNACKLVGKELEVEL